MTPEQVMAELLRENERLRRQVEDARHERDQYKQWYLEEIGRHAPELKSEDIAGAVPARPVIEQFIRRLGGQ